MWSLSSLILTPMASPRAANTPATAMATRAAATAYSESSRPVSSLRKSLSIALILGHLLVKGLGCLQFGQTRSRNGCYANASDPVRRLFASADMRAEFIDLRADRSAQRREGSDDGDSNQRCGNGIFRQLKTGFIAKEFPNHLFAPLVWLWLGYFVRLLPRRKKAREGC